MKLLGRRPAASGIAVVALRIVATMLTGVCLAIAMPGAHVTGITLAMPELDRKRLEVLKEAVPSASRVAFLFNKSPVSEKMAHGADVFAMIRRSATQVDKILKGAKPADLPVELPTKVDLIV